MDDLYRDRVRPESRDVLSVTLFDAAPDAKAAEDAGLYRVVSDDDPAYAAGGVAPRSVGVASRVARLSDRLDLMLKPTTLFLTLPAPMKPGCGYRVRADRVDASIGRLPAAVFDDRSRFNDNVRVNQLGYLPGRAKRAYVGQYLGSGGPMPVPGRRFELLDSRGRAAFAGELSRREAGEDLVGQQVWEADFSGFDRPGTYRLRVEGLGVSYPFVIAADAYDPAYANLMRGNYHQRCGAEVPAPWSRFARPACHLDDALVDPEVQKLKFVSPKAPPLYEADLSVRQRPCTRGHHDAGDYGKYTISGAGYVFAILHAYEVLPERFADDRDDRLGLPTSGDGVPDLLEEAEWELDWLQNMQDTDGGVFGVIRPRSGGYEDFLPPPRSGRLLFPKDTAFTGAYAAALAKAARSPAIRKHHPEDARRYLERSRKAWAWLEKNARFTQYFHYGATFGDADERCWAAAELWLATGEAPFAEYLKKNFDPGQKRWNWWPLFEAQGYAVLSLAASQPRGADPLRDACRAELKADCEALFAWSEANPYRLSFPPDAARSKRYAWIFPGDLAGYPLLMGYQAFGDGRYLQCALDNMNYQMGANPTGHFLFSGLGQKRNIEIVHAPSKFDDIREPSPGIPLGIGSDSLYYLNRYGKRAGEGQYPAQWPLLGRWYDGFNVNTEFTTPQLARETVVAAYFAREPAGPAAPPVVAIRYQADRGHPELAADGLLLHFDLDVKGGGEVRQVFWDFDDESFSTAAGPTHVFSDPGRRHRIAATVVDAAGQWGWTAATVDVPPGKVAYRRQAVGRSDRLVARFPLDGQLDDGDGRKLRLTPGDGGVHRRPYRFEGPASWMNEPRGQVLATWGNEQFTVELPEEAKQALADKGLYLDAMVYVDDFVTRGFPGDPVLLGLKQKWDAWAGLQQNTWDREAAPAFSGPKGPGATAADVARLVPRRRWCQVRIEFSSLKGCQLFVDGQAVGRPTAFTFSPGAKEPLTLCVGPWRGMVDDLAVGRME